MKNATRRVLECLLPCRDRAVRTWRPAFAEWDFWLLPDVSPPAFPPVLPPVFPVQLVSMAHPTSRRVKYLFRQACRFSG